MFQMTFYEKSVNDSAVTALFIGLLCYNVIVEKKAN